MNRIRRAHVTLLSSQELEILDSFNMKFYSFGFKQKKKKEKCWGLISIFSV